MRFYERFGGIALIAGFVCYFLAFGVIVLFWAVATEAEQPTVVDIRGERVEVPEYTAEELNGKTVYEEQVCWHCHSQFVRPVNEERFRWGPVSQPGESAHDRPHLFSTRRIGPDLAREGWRRVDDWHIAHLFNPRFTVKDSVMPAFTWLFRDYPYDDRIRELIAQHDSNGDGIVSKKIDWDPQAWWPNPDETLLEMRSERLDNSGVLAPAYKQADDGADLKPDEEGIRPYQRHDRWTATNASDNLLTLYDARRRITKDGQDLVAYLQRLGTAIGPWREPIAFGTPHRSHRPQMIGVEATFRYPGAVEQTNEAGEVVTDAEGNPVYERAMLEETAFVADGMMPQRNRFARRYGFHRTRAPESELWDAEYWERRYDALMTAWRGQNPDWDRRLAEGKALYDRHCAVCHGEEGRGNGEAAEWLLVRPRDFTVGLYRYRSTPAGNMPMDGDLFRTIYRGLPGTSMPPWNTLTSDQIWLLVDYVKHFRESVGQDRGKPWDPVSVVVTQPAPPEIDVDDYADLVRRGKVVYTAMACNNCHGTEGRGDGPGWNTTTKANGGLIRPRDLRPRDHRDIAALRMRGGAGPEDLYRTIMTGLSGVGMPVPEFANPERAARRLAELEEQGGSEEEIAEARQQARIKLHVPLYDDTLPGVVVEEDAQGNRAEYLERIRPQILEGQAPRGYVSDRWALVLYVMDLAGLEYPYLKR